MGHPVTQQVTYDLLRKMKQSGPRERGCYYAEESVKRCIENQKEAPDGRGSKKSQSRLAITAIVRFIALICSSYSDWPLSAFHSSDGVSSHILGNKGLAAFILQDEPGRFLGGISYKSTPLSSPTAK